MKNILSILALISVLLLAGCTFNCKNVENDNEEVKNVEIDSGEVFNEKSGEVIANDETEEELIAKYKLADTMTLEMDDGLDDIGKDVLSSNSVISEDIEINGEIYKIIVSSEYYLAQESDKNYVQIGNKKITGIWGDEVGDNLLKKGIIKVEDDYFIFLLKSESFCPYIDAYKVTDDLELELIEGVYIEDIRKVGEKYIIPKYLEFEKSELLVADTSYVMGYYYYEDGEWKYINRSLNGKKIIDDDGNLSEEINIERIGYGVDPNEGMVWAREYLHESWDNDRRTGEYEQVLLTKSKYRVKKICGDTYDIEMLEDSEWGDITVLNQYNSEKNEMIIKNKKIVKAGTIVKNLVRPIIEAM